MSTPPSKKRGKGPTPILYKYSQKKKDIIMSTPPLKKKRQGPHPSLIWPPHFVCKGFFYLSIYLSIYLPSLIWNSPFAKVCFFCWRFLFSFFVYFFLFLFIISLEFPTETGRYGNRDSNSNSDANSCKRSIRKSVWQRSQRAGLAETVYMYDISTPFSKAQAETAYP